MERDVLEIRDMVCGYGGVTALRGISLDVQVAWGGYPIATLPWPLSVTVSGYTGTVAVKLAVTLFGASITTSHGVARPVHAPLHWLNVETEFAMLG